MDSSVIIILLLLLSLALGVGVIYLRIKLSRVLMEGSHIKALADNIPDLAWVKDKDSRFLIVNQRFTDVFNLKTREIIGKTDYDLTPDMAHRYIADDKEVMRTKEILHREEMVMRSDGTESWAETIKIPLFGAHGEVVGTAGVARDISQRKESEQKMNYLAHHDALTDLPNRVLLEYEFNRCLEKHREGVDQLIVVFIDLDNFKIINDTVGHAVGDDVLIELSNRLRKSVGNNDIVARIGGDEFVIVLPFTTLEQSHELVENVRASLARPMQIQEMLFETTMSLGVSSYPKDGGDCWTLVQKADLAMYHAKQMGKNQAAVFSQYLADRSLKKMEMDIRIEEALGAEEFEIFYQPKVDVLSGKVKGLEALMRWQDSASGRCVLPEEFIPSAERSGFILKLGDWVIESVIQQVAKWHREGFSIPVSINISATQMHHDQIFDNIKKGLYQYELPGNLLGLELGESIVMENSSRIVDNLESIRDLGVTVSIDNFGTGYSNLAYLSRFPLSSLKVDRFFVSNIDQLSQNQQVACAIIDMARSMELTVIAEGVETKAELEALKTLGVDEAQGFLFDRPLSAETVIKHLKEGWCYSCVTKEAKE